MQSKKETTKQNKVNTIVIDGIKIALKWIDKNILPLLCGIALGVLSADSIYSHINGLPQGVAYGISIALSALFVVKFRS